MSTEAVTVEAPTRTTTRTVRVAGYSFRVETSIGGLVEELDAQLAPFAECRGCDRVYTYELVDRGDSAELRYAVLRDGEVVSENSTASELLATLWWSVNQAVGRVYGKLVLHAGAVADDDAGAAVLLVAPMEAGKSTLTTGLVRRGFAYLTDEAAIVEPDGLAVQPYPKPLTLDRGSWEVFPELRPDLGEGLAPLSHNQWYLAPQRIRPGCVGAGAPVRLVLFVSWSREAPAAELEPVAAPDVVFTLAQASFNFADLGRKAFDITTRLAREAPAYRLRYSDMDSAYEAIRGLLAERIARDGA